jgi:hypothetical protein
VAGVEPLVSPERDLALEYEYRASEPGVLSGEAVKNLANSLEETVWCAAPRLLHPTYRLVSPWREVDVASHLGSPGRAHEKRAAVGSSRLASH